MITYVRLVCIASIKIHVIRPDYIESLHYKTHVEAASAGKKRDYERTLVPFWP